VLNLENPHRLIGGGHLGWAGMLGRLDPTRGIYTAVAASARDGQRVIGEIHHRPGDRAASLAFLLPSSAVQSSAVLDLVDCLAAQAGEWNALTLLAEVAENDPVFEVLRRCGFCVYAWQRIWQLEPQAGGNGTEHSPWQQTNTIDENAVRSLYHLLVPPLVQGAENLPMQHGIGYVYCQKGEARAYFECLFGTRGIFIHPLIHPDVENVNELIDCFIPLMQPILGRPIYLAVRSYQAWLENVLSERQQNATPRYALMVKHLAIQQRLPARDPVLAGIDTSPVRPATPLVHQSTNRPQDLSKYE
jgi:hypothetical protein